MVKYILLGPFSPTARACNHNPLKTEVNSVVDNGQQICARDAADQNTHGGRVAQSLEDLVAEGLRATSDSPSRVVKSDAWTITPVVGIPPRADHGHAPRLR
jgi:hypothetical protein